MKKKWLLSILLCAVLIGSMFSTGVYATEDMPTEPVSMETESVTAEEPPEEDTAVNTAEDTAVDTAVDPEADTRVDTEAEDVSADCAEFSFQLAQDLKFWVRVHEEGDGHSYRFIIVVRDVTESSYFNGIVVIVPGISCGIIVVGLGESKWFTRRILLISKPQSCARHVLGFRTVRHDELFGLRKARMKDPLFDDMNPKSWTVNNSYLHILSSVLHRTQSV